ncbi:MAG TPA: sensor histidine kinase, partial [Actinomycetota bacterium]|nr:sensor histidine kinase [Actinomycetota bacterium]
FGIGIGLFVHRPRRVLGWWLLAAGNLLFVVGDVIYARLATAGVATFPGPNDVVYLAAYPFLATGLVLLVGHSRRRSGSFIDACILATSAGLVAWIFLLEPYASDPSLTFAQRAVSLAYPIGDLLLLATVSWCLFTESRGNRCLRWLLLATGILLISDVVYMVRVLEGTYDGGWADGGYILCYLAFGAAGLEPSMKVLSRVADEDLSAVASPSRMILLAGAALLGPGLLGHTAYSGPGLDLWVMTFGNLILFLLIFLRMGGLMGALKRKAALLVVQGNELSATVKELEAVQDARRHLLDAVHGTAEKERSSLALNLHDGPIQNLTTLSFEVDLAGIAFEKRDEPGMTKALEALESGLSAEVGSLRRLMSDLRPPVLDERGLTQALEDHVEAFIARTGIPCRLDVDLDARLGRDLETMLYRVAQEALTNAARHSCANQVLVTCRSSLERVYLEIHDDGKGFDLLKTDMTGNDGHLGLASIKERIEFVGGTCAINSAVGRGTRLLVIVDLERRDQDETARVAG